MASLCHRQGRGARARQHPEGGDGKRQGVGIGVGVGGGGGDGIRGTWSKTCRVRHPSAFLVGVLSTISLGPAYASASPKSVGARFGALG